MSSLFHWKQIKEESECTHTTKKQLEEFTLLSGYRYSKIIMMCVLERVESFVLE